MNMLAHEVLAPPRWRLGAWAVRAWRRMGWRHVLWALSIEFVRGVMHPLGGTLFPPAEMPGWDPALHFLVGIWALEGIPIVYGVLVADEAFDDGVPPLRAYGSAVAAMVVLIPFIVRLYALAQASGQPIPGFDEGIAQLVWWELAYLYECGFGVSIYGYWRVTQRAMRQAQAAEIERVRNEQRVQTARLLALQARVDPQTLFEALGRVAALHDRESQAADALLADLIALLRSMDPRAAADNPTVEGEFALVEAWLRVTSRSGHVSARVRLDVTPDSRTAGVAPMLVLPLVRTALALPLAAGCAWSLTARLADDRVLVTLQANPDDALHPVDLLGSADPSSLHERLGQLFGRSAHLDVSTSPPTLTLDMPRLRSDADGTGLTGESALAAHAENLPVRTR